jgi:hypothetical protein
MLSLDYVIRQFIRVLRRSREMPRQDVSDFLDCFDQRLTEIVILEMRSHSLHNALPEFVSAFLVNRFVADNGEFMNTRRHKNEHTITLTRFVHTKPLKLFPRGNERIAVQLPALDQNANFTGGSRFRLPNRLNNAIVLEFAEEFSRSHLITSSSPHRHRRNFRRRLRIH